MKKPLIGVMPLYDSEKDSYWMLPGYFKGIENAGGIPIMMPLTSQADTLDSLAQTVDGVLLTGGQDVSPSLYGEAMSSHCGETCGARDAMEQYFINKMIELDKPVLGICRGIQILNTVLGGTLYEDLPSEHPSGTEHHMSPPYDRAIHSVDICADSPLFETLGVTTLGVNSYHHQAIKKLSPELQCMAVSDDRLCEAVFMPGKKFIWAVQWHPEFSYLSDENSRKIFAAFIKAARE